MNEWKSDKMILTFDDVPFIWCKNSYVELNGAENHCDTSLVSMACIPCAFKRIKKFGMASRSGFNGFAWNFRRKLFN